MSLPPRITMCMSNSIDSYCKKKREEQAKYKKFVTAGNNPTITSRGAYSQAQLSRSAVSSAIPITKSYLEQYYYNQQQSEDIFLSQDDATQYFLTKSDAMVEYLSVADSQLNYLALDDAISSYLNKQDASNNYLKIVDASHNYLAIKDASNNYLKIVDASNIYATNIFVNQIYGNTQQVSYLSYNDETTISNNVRLGGINTVGETFTIPKIMINGNVLVGNPTTSDANTQRIQLGDTVQINGSCNDILITPKANGNVVIGGTGINNGCRLDINNGTNVVNIGGSVASHTGNINIGTSTVANNKVNIGSTTIPTYINGNVRIRNQYLDASSTIITGSIVLTTPCNSAYSVAVNTNVVITLPQATNSDIGLKLLFVRVGGTTTATVSFRGAGTQTVYDKILNAFSNSDAPLMGSEINSVTLIYLKSDTTTYGWFQI